jgi:hypothetical protein
MVLLIIKLYIFDTNLKGSLVCNNPLYLKLDFYFLELLYIVNCVNPLHSLNMVDTYTQ